MSKDTNALLRELDEAEQKILKVLQLAASTAEQLSTQDPSQRQAITQNSSEFLQVQQLVRGRPGLEML